VFASVVLSVIRTKRPSSVPAVPPLTVFNILLPNWNPLPVALFNVEVVSKLAIAVAPLVVMVFVELINPLTAKVDPGVIVPIPTSPHTFLLQRN